MTQPSESTQSKPETPTFKDGDRLTIKRGKFGGQSGTMLTDSGDGRYVVKLESGITTMVDPANTRRPDERKFTQSQIVQAIEAEAETDGFATGALVGFADRLGITDEIRWPEEKVTGDE